MADAIPAPDAPSPAKKAQARKISIGAPPEPQVDSKAETGDSVISPATDVPEIIEESAVRRVLEGAGTAANMIAADQDVPDQWKFKDAELRMIVPGLTSYINRSERLRAAVARGDQAMVLVALGNYFGRNLEDGRKARKKRKATDEQSGKTDGTARSAQPQAGRAGGSFAHAAAADVSAAPTTN